MEQKVAVVDEETQVKSLLAKCSRPEDRPVVVNGRDSLCNYSILQRAPWSQKRELVEASRRVPHLDRAMGVMCGMGVGDAMGHMYEFLPAVDKPVATHFELATMTFHRPENTFRLKLGQWTDDAAMGLCIADSLILLRDYDGSDMRARFWCWWNRGYNNAFRLDNSRNESVGLGGNIGKSLQAMSRLKQGENPPPVYKAENEDAGNGSLMRLAPMPVFFHAAAPAELHDYARRSSYTTHPGIIAAEACALLAHVVRMALVRPTGPVDARSFLEEATADYLRSSGLEGKSGWGYDQMRWLATGRPPQPTERCWMWREPLLDIAGTLRARGRRYNGYPVSAGYFGSYSLDGLAMALWAVYHTSTFDEAVAKAINLLGDADSTGSIAGQIAGALYGHSAIHPKFLEWQNRWDEYEIGVRGVLLYHLGRNWAKQHRT